MRVWKPSGNIYGTTNKRASESPERSETRTDVRRVTMSGTWKSAMRFWPIRNATARPIVKRSKNVRNDGEWNAP